MTSCSCYRNNCVGLSIIISIIVGAITAVLSFAAVITVGTAFLWVALGIAVAAFAALVWISAFADCDARRCLKGVLLALITGIFGAILTSVILLAVTFAATSVAGAVITGLLLAFLTLILTTAACFVKCVVEC